MPDGTLPHLRALLPESAVLFSKFFVKLCAQDNREKDVCLSSSSLALAAPPKRLRIVGKRSYSWLLYPADAADEEDSEGLGG